MVYRTDSWLPTTATSTDRGIKHVWFPNPPCQPSFGSGYKFINKLNISGNTKAFNPESYWSPDSTFVYDLSSKQSSFTVWGYVRVLKLKKNCAPFLHLCHFSGWREQKRHSRAPQRVWIFGLQYRRRTTVRGKSFVVFFFFLILPILHVRIFSYSNLSHYTSNCLITSDQSKWPTDQSDSLNAELRLKKLFFLLWQSDPRFVLQLTLSRTLQWPCGSLRTSTCGIRISKNRCRSFYVSAWSMSRIEAWRTLQQKWLFFFSLSLFSIGNCKIY